MEKASAAALVPAAASTASGSSFQRDNSRQGEKYAAVHACSIPPQITRDELVHVLLEGLHINLCVVLGPEAVVMLVLQVDIHSAGSRHVHCVGHSCARGRWCAHE